MHRTFSWAFAALGAFGLCSGSQAADLGIHVILSGQIVPGIYGQVQIGPQEPPPPLVYAEPLIIDSRQRPAPPVYLHVPPGHARNWRKHCHAYNACNRPVYFVRSEEYSSGDEHRDRADHHEHEDHGRGHKEHEDQHDDQ